MILSALGTGVAAGLTNTASAAIGDAYEGLRDTIRRRLGPAADAVVEAYAADPEGAKQQLAQVLASANAGQDAQVIEAAQRLLALTDPVGAAGGMYTVVADLREARGIQVGDRNVQINNF